MLKIFFLIIILFSLTLIFLASTLVYVSLPMYNGTLDAKRNSKYNNITIYRDEIGIPHIKANTFIAGIYGSGVVNA